VLADQEWLNGRSGIGQATLSKVFRTIQKGGVISKTTGGEFEPPQARHNFNIKW
jgi:hypothetical protein